MMRYLVGFVCVLALGVVPMVGCGEAEGARGSGGSAGSGGVGGQGATGGSGNACVDNVCSCTAEGIRAAITRGGGLYTFDCDGPTTVVTQAEIVIDNDVILDGEGNLTVDGDHLERVFSVPNGVKAELHHLTATHGLEIGTGGGVANEGALTIKDCVISGNLSEFEYGYLSGGGILNAGEMTIINSTISQNRVSQGSGGGIYNACFATLMLANSTVSNNGAGADGSGAFGGGIYNAGEMTILNSTVSQNAASGFAGVSGGGIGNSGGMSLINSTVSANRSESGDAIAIDPFPPSCGDPQIEIANTLIDGDCEIDSTLSQGYNIESPSDTCGFDQLTDQANVSADDLNLGELADNGGPTMTHGLLRGSLAIDAIPADMCGLDEDQRGEPRPGGAMCEVGAFEVQP